jgi:hypothetical protein
MTECNWYETPCQRSVIGPQFPQGVQDFVFSIGAPNTWKPCKSFFKIDMSIYSAPVGAGSSILPLLPSQMSAFADNAVGNLYDNVYVRIGEQNVSQIVQYAAQASALDVRLNNTLPWLKSMGSSVAANESSFMKRLQQVTANPGIGIVAGPQLTRINAYADREIYRPVAAANYATATVVITAAPYNAGTVAAQIPLVPNPLFTGYVVTGVNTIFTTGMPSIAGAALGPGIPSSTGGPVLPGDIIVITGVEFEVLSVTGDLALNLTAPVQFVAAGSFPAAATTDWFIVRADAIRAKQASSTVFALWQPPIGLFKFDQELGSGQYRIQLNPNSNYLLNAVECRNPNALTVANLPYNFVINNVKFYAYVEKMSIPDSVRDLYLTEMLIQSKPYSSNLQFSVPPSTTMLTIFMQDNTSGSNPQIPPSMFRVLDNSDLALTNIQVTYANITKPSTNWESNYSVAISNAGGTAFTASGNNKFEQRYHDSYEECGLDIKSCGCETFYDYLQRGPHYTFSFEKDVDNKSTEVQITSVFQMAFGAPATNARMFIVAHYRKTVQITTSNGLVVNVSSREV